MPAPKGHPLWGNPRKPKKYTPKRLWEFALDYFTWCDKHPIMVIEQAKMPQRLTDSMVKSIKPSLIKSFMKQVVELPRPRAYSIEGLCLHLNISRSSFDRYSSGEEYKTYWDTCRAIKDIIDRQHFEYGMSNVFNAGIVTRKLGLADKKELSGENGEPIKIQQITGMVVK